ncbi:MAG: hypothetical protein AB1330_12250 [Bacillota bacterium]
MRQNNAKYPKFFWLLLLLIPLATLFPYLALHYLAPPGTEFTGFFFASDDPESYLANMRLAEYGWKWNFMFTAEDTAGGYIFLYYILLGKLALLLNLPLIVIYHAARIISGMTLILAAWLCLKTLPLTETERKWGLALFSLAIQFPPFYDKYWGLLLIFHPEISPLANILLLPHVAFSQAMFLLTVYFYRKWVREKKITHLLKGNLVLLGLVTVHPYMLLPSLLLISITLYFHHRRFIFKEAAKTGAFFILCTPYLVYLLFLMTQPDMRQWQAQSSTVFTYPWDPVLYNGILAVLGIFGLITISRQKGWQNELPWFCAAPFVLVLFPLSFQERLLEGAGPGLAFAGGVAISSVLSRCRRQGGASLFLILLVPALTVLLAPVFNPSTANFIQEEEVLLYQWMDAHLDRNDVVLAGIAHSLCIPARVGCRVWCGHHDQTFRVKEKYALVKKFFTSSAFDREAFLRKNKIDYVLWDTARFPLQPTNSLVPVKVSGKLVLLRNGVTPPARL